MIKLLIADDHKIMREGLKRLLSSTNDIFVSAEASNGTEVLYQLQNNSFNLLLLDISMPGRSVDELINLICSKYKNIPILVLSMHNEPLIVKRVLKLGAAGYITKDSDPDVLIGAIRKVAMGGKFISSELAENIIFDENKEFSQDPYEELTSRERSIFQLIVSGATINSIGHKLSISEKTVSSHKARIMRKLGIKNNADLIRYAIDHGPAT